MTTDPPTQVGAAPEPPFSTKTVNPLSLPPGKLLNCTTSWTPASVRYREITRPKSMPVLNSGSILTDHQSGSFYVYGGEVPFKPSADTSTLWRFFTDGKGRGMWSNEAPENAATFLHIDRNSRAAYASAKDQGFIFGGKVLNQDSKPMKDNVIGYKTFDFTTKRRGEIVDAPYSADGSLFGATATFVESFGPSGIIVLLGGGVRQDQPASGYLDLHTVYFYDIAEKKWHSQATSGEIPPQRDTGCALGVSDTSHNSSFEIFLFGGTNEDTQTALGSIYALSLPGFTWTLVNNQPGRQRRHHVCVTTGNHLLSSFGGLDFEDDFYGSKDPLPRSIGIFNMNTYSWEDSYDANAGPYLTNAGIKSWYENGGLSSVQWSSDEVRALFGRNPSGTYNGGNLGFGGGRDHTDSVDGEPVGPIVGGVLGGVAGIAFVLVAIWFVMRRRKRRPKEQPCPSAASHSRYDQTPSGMWEWAELSEAAAAQFTLVELDGSGFRQQ
ncbi:hypothetical protein NUW58_g4964 [Xylaria curta]|uniref:Uncharacterized protein n=1 Tax=Xylaria curta TaxID=42375 RepID=A0ACC1P675_9PEZI|nr:hypothetical protein NUW58_g4964 [Xylaria curta]